PAAIFSWRQRVSFPARRSKRQPPNHNGPDLWACATSVAEASQSILGILVVRHDVECLAVVRSRSGLVAQLLVHRPATYVGLGVAGIELDGRVEIGNGALVFALVGVRQS